jgi:hypothetical protein
VSWGKVDDTLHGHPKAIDAGHEAMGLWVEGLSYASAYLTDGHVQRTAGARLAGDEATLERLAARLVRARLWESHPTGDGWQIHDFLQYNPSREQVLAERAAKRAGGRAGAARRWTKGADGSTHGMTQGGSHASAIGIGDAPDPVPSRPVPTQERPLVSLPLTLASEKPSRRERRKPESSAPASDATTAEVEAWLATWSIPHTDEAMRFVNHARSVDRRCRDWTAGWRNWEAKAAEFAATRPGVTRRLPGQQPFDASAPWLQESA